MHNCCKSTIYLLATAANENDRAQKDIAFKNNKPFGSRILTTH